MAEIVIMASSKGPEASILENLSPFFLECVFRVVFANCPTFEEECPSNQGSVRFSRYG